MKGPRETPAPRAPATAALGAVFVAVGRVELATLGGRLERLPGPGRLEESEPYPLRIRLRRTLLPPPGGELSDPLLERSVSVGPRWSRSLERAVWLTSPGRVRLDPARLVVRD